MTKKYFSRFLVAILVLFSTVAHAQEPILFPIFEGGYFGYINQQGNTIIQPQFYAAKDFQEGVAAVRTADGYGYINTAGAMVIKPQYDYARPFSEGLALVTLDEKSFYIDRRGRYMFDCPGTSCGSFKDGVAFMREGQERAFLNNKGKLICKFGRRRTRPLGGGMVKRRALVAIDSILIIPEDTLTVSDNWGFEDDDSYKYDIIRRPQITVFDSTGKVVLKSGPYEEVGHYEGGLFLVKFSKNYKKGKHDYSNKIAIIDRLEKVLAIEKPGYNWNWNDSIPDDLDSSYYTRYVVDMRPNKLSIRKALMPHIDHYEPKYAIYRDERAVLKSGERFGYGGTYILDRAGNLLLPNDSIKYSEDSYEDGTLLIRKDSKDGLIDTEGEYLIPPIFDNISRCGEGLFSFSYSSWREKKGIINKHGKVLTDTLMQAIDKAGFQGGLLRCMIQDRLCYINTNGDIVWRGPNVKECHFPKYPFNIDFMRKDGFWIGYPKEPEQQASPLSKLEENSKLHPDIFPLNAISIRIDTQVSALPYQGSFDGLEIVIANTMDSIGYISNYEGRIEMLIQAKDKNGEWNFIEQLPTPRSCFKHFYKHELPTQQYLNFVAPRYEGSFQTQLRVALKVYLVNDKGKLKRAYVYSNEYEGSINPAQFWNRDPRYRSRQYDAASLLHVYH
ncbi:MAG: WG repeat-containing protein [Bacteroidia bacterium]